MELRTERAACAADETEPGSVVVMQADVLASHVAFRMARL